MPSEQSETPTVHIPPKFNQYGNRQIWFFETGNKWVDEIGNGFLFAFGLAIWFIALAYLRHGGI